MTTKNAGWLGGSDAAHGLGPRNTYGWNHQSANQYNSGYKGGKK